MTDEVTKMYDTKTVFSSCTSLDKTTLQIFLKKHEFTWGGKEKNHICLLVVL